MVQDIKVLSYYYDYFIVSDVRLPEEIEIPKKEFEDAFSIKLKRESDELNDVQKLHITEVGLDNYDDFDYVIDNSGTLDDLKDEAINLLKKIGDIE